MRYRVRGIIFDFDGTIADTIPICIETFRRTVEMFTGRRMGDAEIRAMFGPSDEGMMYSLVPDRFEEAMAWYFKEYERLHSSCSAPFPGILDALRLLRERGVRLGLVTGKSARAAAISLRCVGLEGWFDVVETGSMDGNIKADRIRGVLRRWNIEPRRAAYVGDDPTDVDSARGAGVLALCALWGNPSAGDRMEEKRPDAVFRTASEFIEWIETCLGVDS